MRKILVSLLALLCHASAQEAALAGLAEMLGSDADSLVLYRFRDATWDGVYWTSDNARERPNPELPHKGLSVEALQPLRLAADDSLYLADGETLSHSYVLEIIKAGRPEYRIDVHTDGEGVACLFLIDHTDSVFAEGYAVIGLNRHGAATWLAVLDALWENRNLRVEGEPEEGSLAFLSLPDPFHEAVLAHCAANDDEQYQLIPSLVGPWGMASLFRAPGSPAPTIDAVLACGFDRGAGDARAVGRVRELHRVSAAGSLELRLRVDLIWHGHTTRRALFYLEWILTQDELEPAQWRTRWHGPYFPEE